MRGSGASAECKIEQANDAAIDGGGVLNLERSPDVVAWRFEPQDIDEPNRIGAVAQCWRQLLEAAVSQATAAAGATPVVARDPDREAECMPEVPEPGLHRRVGVQRRGRVATAAHVEEEARDRAEVVREPIAISRREIEHALAHGQVCGPLPQRHADAGKQRVALRNGGVAWNARRRSGSVSQQVQLSRKA